MSIRPAGQLPEMQAEPAVAEGAVAAAEARAVEAVAAPLAAQAAGWANLGPCSDMRQSGGAR